MKIFFTKMLDANELISSFNKPVNHYKQGNVCEVNEVNGQVKWQMSNFSVYYWKTERQALLATRIFLLFGGIFCHFLFLAVKQGIQITFFHGIYINNYWDLENIFHKWDETNTCCNKTTSLKHRKQQSSKPGYKLKIFTWFSWILSTNPFTSAPLWNICSTESSSKEHNI